VDEVSRTTRRKKNLWDECCAPALAGAVRRGYILTLVLFVILLSSCELFNGASDPEYLDKLYDEIAWANAERLTVTVGFPAEWGSSPQRGTGRSGDTRLGYAFNVEFGAMPGYGFEKWLAFPTSIYDTLDKTLSALEIEGSALPENLVEIIASQTVSGAHAASVTIYITEPVTLVPWCGDRPRIIQSNPPLIGSGFYYTRGQQIVMKFSMPLIYEDKQEIEFGEDTITITGQGADGAMWVRGSLPYETFQENYFETPVYDSTNQTITITPIEGSEPPEYFTITVTVGTGIIGANGKNFSAPLSFSYRTSDEVVTRAYKANDIWGIRASVDNPNVSSFFYQMAPAERDRRLLTNSSGDYTVNLYFSVSRSVGEIPDIDPDKINVAQIYYADIGGRLITQEGYKVDEENENIFRKDSYNFSIIETSSNSAGLIYRQMNNTINPLGVNYYRVTYTFPAETEAGIYRLVILPEREVPTQGETVPADPWETAVNEGRFVTVVIGEMRPNNNGALIISGHNSYSDTIYNFVRIINRNLIITTNFSNIHDNGGNGILLGQSTPDKPWTIDDQRNLQWRWRIYNFTDPSEPEGKGVNDSLATHDAFAWMPIGINPSPFDLQRNISTSDDRIWDIEIQFKNTLGYESGWFVPERISFSTVAKASTVITEWNALYTEGANNGIITLDWENPVGINTIRVSIYKKSYSTTTPIWQEDIEDDSRVVISESRMSKMNTSVFSPDEYEITLQNIGSNDEPVPNTEVSAYIFNIPGMRLVNGDDVNTFIVNNFNDNADSATTRGTLRYALTRANINAAENSPIYFMGVTPGVTTISLTRALPQILSNVTIEGNGVILSRTDAFTPTTGSQLLRIGSSSPVSSGGIRPTVSINRVHFKDGRSRNSGAAISNFGKTTLRSCIFSGNETDGGNNNSADGGAIRNESGAEMTIMGCTFINNRAINTSSQAPSGAAIYSSASLNISGNVFYNNRASNTGTGIPNSHVIRGTVTSDGFNITDRPFGIGITNSERAIQTGFTSHATRRDRSIPSVPLVATDVSNTSTYLRPLNFTGGAMDAVGSSRPDDYPTVDFFGNTIPAGTAHAGAIQELAPVPAGRRYVIITDFGGGTGTGTLRHALLSTQLQNGDIIVLTGVTPGTSTINLAGTLSFTRDITVTIEGNGITIYRGGRQIEKTNGDVTIRRVHFKGDNNPEPPNTSGRGQFQYGTPGGSLTLESCIFSDFATSNEGGAIQNSSGTLVVRGCTFYNNRGGNDSGGAINNNNTSEGSLILAGNLFYANTSRSGNYNVISGSATSYGYNVVNFSIGIETGMSGFAQALNDTDRTFQDRGFNNNQTFPFDGNASTTSFWPFGPLLRNHINDTTWAGTNMPETDFYGLPRKHTMGLTGAPGAVERQ